MPRDQARILTITCFIFLLNGFFAGCSRPYRSKAETEKEVKSILSMRERAMESKDIGLYMACISRDYKDKTDTYVLIYERMQKNFDAFDMIEFSQFNQTIYQDDGMVMVVQDYELVFTIGGKRDYVRGKERIFLERKDKGWKIVKGL